MVQASNRFHKATKYGLGDGPVFLEVILDLTWTSLAQMAGSRVLLFQFERPSHSKPPAISELIDGDAVMQQHDILPDGLRQHVLQDLAGQVGFVLVASRRQDPEGMVSTVLG